MVSVAPTLSPPQQGLPGAQLFHLWDGSSTFIYFLKSFSQDKSTVKFGLSLGATASSAQITLLLRIHASLWTRLSACYQSCPVQS